MEIRDKVKIIRVNVLDILLIGVLSCFIVFELKSVSCAQYNPADKTYKTSVDFQSEEELEGLHYSHFRLSAEVKKAKVWKGPKNISRSTAGYAHQTTLKRDMAINIFNSGLAYGLQGKFNPAIDEFSKYLTLYPKDTDAYYNRALVYALKGQFDQALADINRTIGTNPNDAQAYYLRGFIHLKKKELNSSRIDYQKASELDPDFVRQVRKDTTELCQYALILEGKKEPTRQDKEHKHKGKTLAQQGEYSQAMSELDQALALDPKDVENYTRRGGIYTLQKQYDKAIDDFNRALELDPSYAKAYYNRALAYYYQGKYNQALADLQKTIELKPKDAEAYHNRGLVYIEKKDYGKAIDDFNMAIALNPKLADAFFNKAATCERSGRQDEAQEAYAAYLKVAPPEAKAQIEQARSRLR